MLSHSLFYALGKIVGADNLLTDAQYLANFCCDKSTQFKANIGAVVYPQSTEQVRDLVLLANREKLRLVPSGGRTGLSGGAVALNGEIILSLDKMNRILTLNAIDQTVDCQAGVITQTLQDYAKQQGLFYPVDFASAGSSQIGGNISTNAGGINVIRYGMTRNQVAGLTVVTGKGDILQLNHALKKNNTGFDLMQLFIGAEGTLGIVTEATLRLCKPPQALSVALLAVDDFEHLMALLLHFQSQFTLNAFEFFSEQAMQKVLDEGFVSAPNIKAAPFYALIECESAEQESFLNSLQHCLDQQLASDAIVSQNAKQAANLWRLRKDISSSIAKFSPYKNDLSVKISDTASFLNQVNTFIAQFYPDFEVLWYGHIGDGNLHLNILKPDNYSQEQFGEYCSEASKTIMQIVENYHGSVSAEHGVGLLKKDYLHFSKSSEEIAYMKAIKAVFDPNGVLNIDKIWPYT